MAVTTLLDLAKQQYADTQAACDQATKTAAAAQKSSTDANASYTAASASFAGLQKQLVAVRNQLAAIPTAGDGNRLVAQLEQSMIALRRAQAAQLQAEEVAAAARWSASRAAADLARTAARLKAADAALKQADQDNTRRDALKTKLGAAPLAGLPAAAKAALGPAPAGQAYQDAKARIEADLPSDLLDRARARRTDLAGFLDAVHDAAATGRANYLAESANQGGPSGAVAKLSAALADAEAACTDLTANGQARYDRALASLARIAHKSVDALTDAQRAAILAESPARKDAVAQEKKREDALSLLLALRKTLQTDGLAAAANPGDAGLAAQAAAAEKAVEKAQSDYAALLKSWNAAAAARDVASDALDAATAALDQAREKAKAKLAKPTDDVENDPAVQAAEKAVQDARAAFDKAQAAYEASPKGALEEWQAAVPDTSWQQLYDFDESVLQLTRLGSSDPAKLGAALVQAEADLVAGMVKAAASADLLDGLAVARDGTKARLDFETNARQRWLLSALRGDGDQPPSWHTAVPGGDAPTAAAPAEGPAKPQPA
jgi:hypothetical protein